jgi:hypothetical protein
MSPEMKYKIERAKDNTKSTDWFLMLGAIGFIVAYLCRGL